MPDTTTAALTLREAADIIERGTAPGADAAVRLLIGHARATPPAREGVAALNDAATTIGLCAADVQDGKTIPSDVRDSVVGFLQNAADTVACHRCAPSPADGSDLPAFVVMSERRTELAYKGVHTREAAESLAGGFDDVEVRGAEDVIRELCEQVARLEASAPAADWTAECACTHIANQHDGARFEGPCNGLVGGDSPGATGYPVETSCDCEGFKTQPAESEAANGELYLHMLRCVKGACTDDCPRRHEDGGRALPEPAWVREGAAPADGTDAGPLARWETSAGDEVRVNDDREVLANPKRGSYVHAPEEFGLAVLAAHAWAEDTAPVARGERVSGTRAANAPQGTLVVRLNDDGRARPGEPVTVTGPDFVGVRKQQWMVLDLPAIDGSS